MIAVYQNLPPSGQPRLYSDDGSAYSVTWWMYSSLTFICPHFCAFDRTNIPSMHWTAMSILAEELLSEDEIQCDWFQYSTCDSQIVSPIPLWLSYVQILAHFIVKTYQVCIGQLWAYLLRNIHQKLKFSVIGFNILLVMVKLNHPQYQKITPIPGMFKEWTCGCIIGKFCSIWPLM